MTYRGILNSSDELINDAAYGMFVPSEYLHPGDECLLINKQNGDVSKVWVYTIKTSANVVCKLNPAAGTKMSFGASKEILSTNAVEYSQNWQTFNEYHPDFICDTSIYAGDFKDYISKMIQLGYLSTSHQLDDPYPPVGWSSLVPSIWSTFNGLTPILHTVVEKNSTKMVFRISPNCQFCGCFITMEALPGETINFDNITAMTDFQPDLNNKPYGFKIKVVVGGTEKWLKCSNTCFPIVVCDKIQCRTTPEQNVINPWQASVLGNWRPLKQYAYLGERTYSAVLNTRKDGYYTTFNPFWQFATASTPFTSSTSDPSWTWSNQATKYTPFGFDVENIDALTRPSAALYRYNNTLPVAVASNAKYTDIAFDNFEDYGFVSVSG
ncbi:MAG: hypothetical protein ABL870_10230, partial [Sediminibacterium sp.]